MKKELLKIRYKFLFALILSFSLFSQSARSKIIIKEGNLAEFNIEIVQPNQFVSILHLVIIGYLLGVPNDYLIDVATKLRRKD